MLQLGQKNINRQQLLDMARGTSGQRESAEKKNVD